MRRLLTNLRQGLRLAFLRAPRPVPGIGQLLLLMALGWLCAFVGDWQQAPAAATFAPWGFTAAAARSYLWLAAVALIAALERGRTTFLPLAVALAAADVVLWLIWLSVIAWWPALMPADSGKLLNTLWVILSAWQVAILLPALRGVSGEFRHRHFGYALLYAVMLYATHELMPDYPLLESSAAVADPALDIEGIYSRQPDLLQRALQRMAPGQPGRRDLFAVTFAGFGEEDVFRREAMQVADIIGKRFEAADRQLQLINNRATLDTHALASRSNLAVALRAIARKMQREEDILFLFLTSHGAQDGAFAIQLGALGLNDLRPSELRAALDEAGIRWRVIVVSACYSGQFITALAEPHTLLLTAAASDRASFGCAHENSWTYFGEAFFNQALHESASFEAAFKKARRLIRIRERREGKEPSQPQVRMGVAVAPVLREFEGRFR